MIFKKKSQVWIETVIYTLITITIIGVVLGIVKPAIDQGKDKTAITQSIDTLNGIDAKINEVKYAPGNSRNLGLKITRGKLIIDGIDDRIMIIIDDSTYQYAEINKKINEGNIVIETGKKNNKYNITLSLDYGDKFNITYMGKSNIQTIQPSPSVYNLLVINRGKVYYPTDNSTYIDFFS
jgi:hypothetical protein